jgi:hypothetical protein
MVADSCRFPGRSILPGNELKGNLEKLSFRPISSLRIQISSWQYHSYACGKIFVRASILNEIPILSSSPKDGAVPGRCRHGNRWRNVSKISFRLHLGNSYSEQHPAYRGSIG